MKGSAIWRVVLPWIRNKFILTAVVFGVWMLIFDRSNWIDLVSKINQIRNMEKEKEYYMEKIESDRKKLYELRTNDENLEKFAREQYVMKSPNEKVYLITE